VDQMNAAYNYFIVDYDGSYGVHNPKLAVALLEDALASLPKPESCLACDVNGDNRRGIADVVSFLLMARANPYNLCLDRNEDGVYNTSDLIGLIHQIFGRTCPGSPSLSMLASAGEDDFFAGIPSLSREDVDYIESVLSQVDLTGEQQAAFRVALSGHAGAASLPKTFALAQNAPNPFNPATAISYSVPDGTSLAVSLAVYDIRGKLVRTLVNQVKNAGTYTVFWDGSDESGVQVSSGVYFYRMMAGSFIQTRKMVLLK